MACAVPDISSNRGQASGGKAQGVGAAPRLVNIAAVPMQVGVAKNLREPFRLFPMVQPDPIDVFGKVKHRVKWPWLLV